MSHPSGKTRKTQHHASFPSLAPQRALAGSSMQRSIRGRSGSSNPARGSGIQACGQPAPALMAVLDSMPSAADPNPPPVGTASDTQLSSLVAISGGTPTSYPAQDHTPSNDISFPADIGSDSTSADTDLTQVESASNSSSTASVEPTEAHHLHHGAASPKLPARKLSDLLESLFEAHDEIPVPGDQYVPTGVSSPCKAWTNELFEMADGAHIILKEASLARVVHLLQASIPTFEEYAQREVLSQPQLERIHPCPRQLYELDHTDLSRLLHILQETASTVEGFVFSPIPNGVTPTRKRKRPQDRLGPNRQESQCHQDTFVGYTGLLTRTLLAAQGIFILLSAPNPPGALLSEEAVQSGLMAVKTCVDSVIMPFMETCSGCSTECRVGGIPFWEAVTQTPLTKPKVSKKCEETPGLEISSVLVKLFKLCQDALSCFYRLCTSGNFALSNSLIISGMYLVLKPLCAPMPDPQATTDSRVGQVTRLCQQLDEVTGTGQGPFMGKLRSSCLSLARFIIARYPEQRTWILDELLTGWSSLAHTQAKRKQRCISSNTSVHPITLLLVQIIQSVGLSGTADSSASTAQASECEADVPLLDGSSPLAPLSDDVPSFQKKFNRQPYENAGSGLESAINASRMITSFLLDKFLSQPKMNKSAVAPAYSNPIETLLADLLAIVFSPEWPAAAVLLTYLGYGLLKLLAEGSHTEVRGVAAKLIGGVAAQLRSTENNTAEAKMTHTRFSTAWTADQVSSVVDGYTHTIQWLSRSSGSWADTQVIDSATHFWSLRALADVDRMDEIVREAASDLENPENCDKLHQTISEKKRVFLKSSWSTTDNSQTGPFHPSQKNIEGENIIKMLTVTSPTLITFESCKQGLLRALDDASIPLRLSALRAANSIYAVDSGLVSDPVVQKAIEERIIDTSPAVREQAIKLLGEVLLRAPYLVGGYLPSVLMRLSDSANGVRRRVIRIITDLYSASQANTVRVKLCTSIVQAAAFDTTELQPALLNALGQMLFDLHPDKSTVDITPTQLSHAIQSSDNATQHQMASVLSAPLCSSSDPEKATRAILSKNAATMVLVVHQMRERTLTLEAACKALSRNIPASSRPQFHGKLQKLVDELMRYSDPIYVTDAKDVGPSDYLKAILIVLSAHPGALSVARAKDLLTHLVGNKAPEEMFQTEMALRILSTSIPHLPPASRQFTEHLQKLLVELVNRPPSVSPAAPLIHELIACFCVTSVQLSRDPSILIRVLAACLIRARQVVAQMTSPGLACAPTSGGSEQLELPDRPKALVVAMCTLLCEHADFDRLRLQHPHLAPSINQVAGPSVVTTMYNLLMRLYESRWPVWKLVAVQNLGWLMRSHAHLWMKEPTLFLLDHIFAGANVRQKEYAIRLVSDYLEKEHRRQADENDDGEANERSSNQTGTLGVVQLVGNVDDFAESSISSQIVQRYLASFLDTAVDASSGLMQRLSMGIIDHAITRGLSHPLQCVTTLVALETSVDRWLADKALRLHSQLAGKYGSLLTKRDVENVRTAYAYQRRLQKEDFDVRGYRLVDSGRSGETVKKDAVALLAPWLSLYSDKRKRLDMLRALVRCLDCDTSSEAEPITADQVLFTRFVADNLALLPYRSMDEVLTVLHDLKTIISTTGIQVLYLAQSNAPAHGGTCIDQARLYCPQTTRAQRRAVFPYKQQQSTSKSCMDNSHAARSSAESRLVPATQLPIYHNETEKLKDMEALARMCQLAGIVLTLRNHIKWMYNLCEDKCDQPKAASRGKRKGANVAQDKPPQLRHFPDKAMAILPLDSQQQHLTWNHLSAEQARGVIERYQNLVAQEGTELEQDMGMPDREPETMLDNAENVTTC